MKPNEPASKAAWLSLVVRSGLGRYVPRFAIIGAAEWQNNPSVCLTRIQMCFPSERVAVRSSRHNESGGVTGQAGRYRSFGPVDATRRGALTRAVDAVFKRYGELHDADEVLVQTWVAEAAAMLGVTSANSTSFAGTASISYHVGDTLHGANTTNAITAGWTNVQRFWLAHNTGPSSRWPSAVRRAFALLATLEATLVHTALELEVAVDCRGRLRLLQVTPSTRASTRTAHAVLETRWQKIEHTYDQRMQPREAELGRDTVFGLMPDWNPAELLGEHPRPLALSLFSELLTDHVWRDARINLGYRESAVHPLLGVFAGRPYVDVRASLNSLIPRGLSEPMVTPVIKASIDKLRRHPELHDRVETELQPTCIGFAGEWSQSLTGAGLSKPAQQTWREGLIAMEPAWRRFSASPNAAERIVSSVRAVEASCRACNNVHDLMLILGTIQQVFALPFAMQARLAFVARFQLSSLVTANALSAKRHHDLLRCLSVTTSTLSSSAISAGALRPATFDICVDPIEIDAAITGLSRAQPIVARRFKLTKTENGAVALLLKSQRLEVDVDADGWVATALRRIELRELWKYGLSQALSHWLSALTRWGKLHSLSRLDLSYLTVKHLASGNDIVRLRRQSASARARYGIESTIKMPLLIENRRDFRASTDPALRPSFQAQGTSRVSAPLCRVARHTDSCELIAGAVVLIHAADPGYDWIFQYPLVALVTCYGGPHSHMAVRCAELNVPCVLGCGESVYAALRDAARVTIDFEQQHLSVD